MCSDVLLRLLARHARLQAADQADAELHHAILRSQHLGREADRQPQVSAFGRTACRRTGNETTAA